MGKSKEILLSNKVKLTKITYLENYFIKSPKSKRSRLFIMILITSPSQFYFPRL